MLSFAKGSLRVYCYGELCIRLRNHDCSISWEELYGKADKSPGDIFSMRLWDGEIHIDVMKETKSVYIYRFSKSGRILGSMHIDSEIIETIRGVA